MLADTTFLIDFYAERVARRQGPATVCMARHRTDVFRISVVSIAEFSAGFQNPLQARVFLDTFQALRLFPEAAYEAGAIDRESEMEISLIYHFTRSASLYNFCQCSKF